MAEKQEQRTVIYEERNEKMVSLKDGGESKVRIARFLKPCAEENANQEVGIPNSPEFFPPHNRQHWHSKVIFEGWYCPQKRWREWFEILAGKHGAIWNQIGIYDAITSSTFEVRCNSDLVLGLSEFWCPDTNTFVFPWGEATITLEDVMILGGLPVVGEPVTVPLPEELVKIEEVMNAERRKMSRSKSRKAEHSTWLNHFMEKEREEEFEHVAFLSLWLSRYVFPSLPKKTIGKHVFPIAANLSRGTPMALAPAVLACLYRDLRSLREQAMASKESIVVSGPFQLLQLWALERFPLLGPNSPKSLKPGEPRVARWDKLNFKINLPLVRSALQLAENFQWRPYAADLKNWRHFSYYLEIEQLLVNSSSLDRELRSFFRCLQVSELVGIDCKEKYLPNRVAMQFGMDQDIPADPSGFDFSGENVGFIVPPRSFHPGVSRRYIKWWKDMMLARECAKPQVDVSINPGLKSKTSSSSVQPQKSSGCGELDQVLTKLGSKLWKDMMLARECAKPQFDVSINPGLKSKSSSSSVQPQKSSGCGELDQVLTKLGSKLWKDMMLARECAKPQVDVSINPGLKSKISSTSVQPQKSSGCGELDQVLTKLGSKKKCQAGSDSSDDHHLPIAPGFEKIARNVGSSASTFGNEEKRKRDSRILPEGKAGKSISNGRNGIDAEVKTEVGCSINDAIDVDATNGAAEIGKRRRKAEGSFHNPICVDSYMEINKSRIGKDGKHLEGRVEKLEKMLGVVPD